MEMNGQQLIKLSSTTVGVIEDALSTENLNTLNELLQNEFKIVRDKSTNEPILFLYDEQVLSSLRSVLLYVEKVLSTKPSEQVFTLTINLFKALRNYCLTKEACEAVLNDSLLLEKTEQILSVHSDFPSELVFIRFILEFLSNICVVSKTHRMILYSRFKNLLASCVSNEKYSSKGCAFAYNLLLDLNNIEISSEFYETILNTTKDSDFDDYLHLLISYVFVLHKNFINFYTNLSLNKKLLVLKSIKYHYVCNNCPKKIHCDLYKVFMNEFQENSAAILSTAKENAEETAIQVVFLLEIITSFGSSDDYLHSLQNDTLLLITCCTLLKTMHECGKSSQNNFTPIEKLSDLAQPKKEIEEHPAFGFKANLIRLLGIFVYKNRKNQQILNEHSIIPLILDCCNLDARNPFIMQCAILTIRNICEDNSNNQAIIASLTEKGTVSSALLQELGITLHADGDNKIGIVPLDSVKNGKV